MLSASAPMYALEAVSSADDIALQNSQRTGDELRTIVSGNFTYKYGDRLKGEEGSVALNDGSTAATMWIKKINNQTGEENVIITDAFRGLAVSDKYIYFTSMVYNTPDAFQCYGGLDYVRTDLNGQNREILYHDDYTPYGTGVTFPGILLTTDKLYLYEGDIISIDVNTKEIKTVLSNISESTGADWINLDFVYNGQFFFSTTDNGMCSPDGFDCSAYYCFSEGKLTAIAENKGIYAEGGSDEKLFDSAVHSSAKTSLSPSGIKFHPYTSKNSTYSYDGCFLNFSTMKLEKLNGSFSKGVSPLQYLLFSELAYKNLADYIGKDMAESADTLYPQDKDGSMFKNDTGTLSKAVLIEKYLSGWTVEKILKNASSGFYAAVFENTFTEEKVIAFRGSQAILTPEGNKDWADDATYALLNETSPQMYDAASEVSKYLDSCQTDKDLISVTGHSLGGALGILTANLFNLYAETFDAGQMLDVSYYRWNCAFVSAFSGIDKWTYTDHVNEYDLAIGNYEFNIKNAVKHKSTLEAKEHLNNHSRDALLVIDESAQDARLSDIIATNDSKTMGIISKNVTHHNALLITGALVGGLKISSAIDKMLPKGSLVMGTSSSESLFGYSDNVAWYINTIAVPHTDVIYGGDGSDRIMSFSGDDYIIPGNGDDTVYGDSGDDRYIYCKGQGTDTIFDYDGNDTIYIYGYTTDEIKGFKVDTDSDNCFILITDNSGNKIFKIYTSGGLSTHSIDVKCSTGSGSTSVTRLVDWNKIQKVKKIRIGCPVDVAVYNGNGEEITVLRDGTESVFANEDGVFSVVYDGKDYVKCIDSTDDSYTYKIRCIADGTMSISERSDSESGEVTSYTAESITIKSGAEMTLSCSGENAPVLTGADCSFKQSSYVPVRSLSSESTSIRLKVGKQAAASLKISPQNTTANTVEWTSNDETVATVDQGGTITAVAVGSAQITAETDGKVLIYNIYVEEKTSAAKIILPIVILVVLIIAAVLVIKKLRGRKKKAL